VVLASGAAKGVDETAMLGSLAAGGCAIGVVADSLEKVSARPIWRQALVEGRLLLLSSDTPSARFQVWRAMARNKLIYALADAALVVSSAKGEGGTWAGATEQLQKLQFCPLHVLSDPRGGAGLAALAEIGARPWSNPASAEALQALLRDTELPQATTPATAPAEMEQGSLLESALIEPPQANSHPDLAAAAAPDAVGSLPEQPHPISKTEEVNPPAVALADFVDDLLLSCLEQPCSIDELAEVLDVSKAEVKRWCLRLVDQGRLRKLTRPVRYVRQGLPS
jgi:predicted Rossmann fold nucleotide-binding protein DprA/Smf involved in DNA uptake